MARKNTQSNNPQNIVLIVIAVLLLVIGTAAASVYIAKNTGNKEVAAKPAVTHVVREQRVQTQQVATKCDDGNIVGKGLGGIAGGALASNVGKGKGKTAATIGGTLGGAYLGGEYIPTHGVACR